MSADLAAYTSSDANLDTLTRESELELVRETA